MWIEDQSSGSYYLPELDSLSGRLKNQALNDQPDNNDK
jgi:hypothetical protein